MGKATKSRSHSKPAQNLSRAAAKRQPAPYALVFYVAEKKTGVIERRTLANPNALVGSSCLVPCPLDMEADGGKKFKAIIVQYGYDLEFLGRLLVDTNGKLIGDLTIEVDVAGKQARVAQAAGAEASISLITENLPSIDFTNNGPTVELPSQNLNPNERPALTSMLFRRSEEVTVECDIENPNVANQRESGASNNPNLLQPEGILLQSTAAGSRDGTTSVDDCSIMGFNCPAEARLQCPLGAILENASSENKTFLQSVCGALWLHLQNTASSSTAGSSVPEVSNLAGVSQGLVGIVSPTHNLTQRLLELPCLQKSDDLMFPLVEGVDVFLHKTVVMSLPITVPKPPDSNRKKKPADRGKMYPRGFTNYLLDLLIPIGLLKVSTVQDLPKQIKTAIKAYVNYWLPEGEKMMELDFNTYVTDHIRNINRNRPVKPSKST